jgi:plasmid replication initiation protein
MAAYDKERHYLEIRLSHEIIPYLDVSIKYVKTRLYQIAKLSSVYSIRLYELITSFRSLGKCSMSVERLRFLLGVGENKLKEYADFKRKALTPAINEVNKVCNFDISSIEIKTGKKVAEIGLTFKKPKKKEFEDDLLENNKTLSITQQEDIKTRLIKSKVETRTIKELLKYPKAKLKIACEKLEQQMRKGHVKNPTGYFRVLMEQKTFSN